MDPYPRPGTWRERLYIIIFHTYTRPEDSSTPCCWRSSWPAWAW